MTNYWIEQLRKPEVAGYMEHNHILLIGIMICALERRSSPIAMMMWLWRLLPYSPLPGDGAEWKKNHTK
jgi:hypothetical protein